jgi:hypothetical protein
MAPHATQAASGVKERQTPQRRTWPAILTLYMLAPIMGEVLSWSTPPLALILDPTKLIFEPALYGSGAIVIREIVRRTHGDWGNILVLGAAYGVLEEGIDVQTWFNPAGLHGLGIYGRAWDVNWVWAMGLTVFHMVCSITIPIILTEALFPDRADQPWLGKIGRRWLVAWFVVTTVLGALGYGFILGKKAGYFHPPFPQYLLAVGITAALFVLGRRLAFPAPAQRSSRQPPRLWTARLAAFAATAVFFLAFYGLPSLVPFAPTTIAVLSLIVLLAALQARAWAMRPGWNDAHRLALASGVTSFWLVVSPVFFVTGLPLVALAFLILLILLARRAERKRQPLSPIAEGYLL